MPLDTYTHGYTACIVLEPTGPAGFAAQALPAAAYEACNPLQVPPGVAAEVPAHLQALADRDAQVASLRQELAHASSGAGETSDEVIRLKAELESSRQVIHLCRTSGLRLVAPVLQTTLWPFAALKRLLLFKQPGSLSKAAALPSRQSCTKVH